MVNTRAWEPTACLVFSSDTPATFVSLCILTTNQQLCAHVCIQMQVLFAVTCILVFFPVPTLEEVKGIAYFTFLCLKIKCHSSTELCLVLDEGVMHLTLLCYLYSCKESVQIYLVFKY